jgi:Methyltransferase domain
VGLLKVRPRLGRLEASPQRLAGAAGLAVGLLATAAGMINDRRVRAAGLGSVAGLSIGVTLRLLLAETRELRQESHDLWGLSHAMVDGNPWPAPGGWALGADALLWILRQIDADSPCTVVELGPGASTVILCSCRPHIKSVGVEHDDQYVAQLASEIGTHGIENHELLHAPLVTQGYEGTTGEWYDPGVLGRLPLQIDLLIVDGPPNWDGGQNRSPAWPLLRDRLGPGALILVDDTQRGAERAMVDSWVGKGGLTQIHDGGTFTVLAVDGDAGQRP